MNAAAHLASPNVQQAIHNLRDEFKKNHRMLLLVSSHIIIPECLQNDVVLVNEPSPSRDELSKLITKVMEQAGAKNYKPDNGDIDAVHGLPSFQAEQALTLGLKKSKAGAELDLPTVWTLKKQLIETTRGLSVWSGGEKFDSLGGLDGIKRDLTELFRGPRPPQVIVWLDEIEKSAINSTKDSNGINADMLGTMLGYMEDHNVIGKCLVGLPGTGKSAIAKATGGEFGRLVVKLDLAALKQGLVGASESNMRAALRLISAVGGDNALFLATANSIDTMDSALIARFSDTFFFDLPTKEELAPVWEIQRKRYGVQDKALPLDTVGWVGRNVKQCCERAYRHNVSLKDASRYVIPTGVSAKDEVEKLKEKARGRFLNASTGFVCE
jgi:hypothetical protein